MFADAEAMTIAYLTEHLPDALADWIDYGDQVSISTFVPDPRPGRIVRVQLSGSERRTVVHRDSKITIECWSDRGEEDAARLMEAVYGVIDDWELVPPFRGWPSGPYRQPDPATATARYVATCLLNHRAEDD